MIQYLHSWFPGWGGWYGFAQDADGPPEELLASPSSWNILGKKPPCVCDVTLEKNPWRRFHPHPCNFSLRQQTRTIFSAHWKTLSL